MPELRLAGCRPQPLAGYLKALGLVRSLGRQADRQLQARWTNDALELTTMLDADELKRFLLERYVPTPVISPWNGGSGFFPKDNTQAFDAIDASDDVRLQPFKAAMVVARSTLHDLGIVEKPADRDQKLTILRILQATLPDEALDWLEAAVVLTGADEVGFPPLLGSGGNDGRFDIANNYAQAVVTVLDPAAREQSAALLRAALDRDIVPLTAQSMAHFMRDASPVSSPSGDASGLSNPWDLVLAIEGTLMLIAGAARRHGLIAETTMSAPFTARATAAGYGTAVAGERGRAELWMPLWSRWMGVAELETLMREGRAQVGRRAARTGLDFARAAAQLGVDRGIAAFARYALLERAGQSTLAVFAGRFEVRERPAAGAIETLEPSLSRVLGYGAGDCPRAHAQAIRILERAVFGLAQHGRPTDACAVIEALGSVESLLAMSALPAALAGLRPLDRAPALPWLEACDDGSGELAVAAALASLQDRRSAGALPGMRDYLHGTGRDARGRRVYLTRLSGGLQRRADAVTRLAQLHRRRQIDAQRAGRSSTQSYAFGLSCPLPLAVAFAAGGMLDDARIGRLLAGLCLLDFQDAGRWRPSWSGPATAYPAFELLALAWAGTSNRERVDEARDAGKVPRVVLAPRAGWAAKLAAGKADPVLHDALLRLRMARLSPIPRAEDLTVPATAAPRLAAALLLRLSESDRRWIASRLCEPTVVESLQGAA
ncbi:MAG TPA: type I-U CRISPR-associated protein Csx17 [Conexibacter sp.]|nr:type I-U CRISPR-associated protein Csx17 [Conexibacter sp.]